MHRLTKAQARRIAVRAQLLDAPRPTELLAVVQRLTLLQIDPTAAIAPSADLVAWSRLGSAYQPADLKHALEEDRTLFEHNALVRPMSDLGLYLAGAADWPSYDHWRVWLRDNDRFRRDILELLGSSGPLTSRDIPDTCLVPWASTGWTNNRNVTQMLEAMMMRGEIAISGRVGRERLWDLPGRVYPADVVVPSADEAERAKNERRLASLGIARQKATVMPGEPNAVGEAGEPAVVEGTKGEWRVDPAALDQDFEGRTALLSPFDRLVHDRARAEQLFDFEYTLEMYKPAAQRRWGYFALPILHGDRLVGKLDAKADRKTSVLRVHAIHEDVRFTRAITRAVEAELGIWRRGSAWRRSSRASAARRCEASPRARPAVFGGYRPQPRASTSSDVDEGELMSGYTVSHLDEIDEMNDGRLPYRPVRHHFGITGFGVTAWTARDAGERIINEHDESGRGRGALPRPGGARCVRARQRSGGRARRHLRPCPPRGDAHGVRRGAADDDRRFRRRRWKGVRGERLGGLGAVLAALREG